MSARIQSQFPVWLLCALFAGASTTTACTGKGQPHKEGPAPSATADPKLPPLTRSAPSNGWSDDIAWQPLDDALETAKKREQPVMLVVHASWCNRCKELKPKFQDDAELRKLSEQFVMVNADQDLERKSLEFAPDGDYIPRVIFIDPKTGKADASLLNERRNRSKYFYTPNDNLVGVMKEALARYGKT